MARPHRMPESAHLRIFCQKPLDVASGRPKCMGMLFRLLILLQMMFVAPALAQSAQPQTFAQQEHTRIELVAEQSSVAAGKPLTIAVVMTPQPGWHTYWQNPGDSGSATRLNWKLPEGWSASAPAYPTPKRFTVAQLVSYVYDKPSRLLVTLTAPSIPQGQPRFPSRCRPTGWCAMMKSACRRLLRWR
ncbi:hypothetical protein E6W36_09425 [Hankyongella ginsenosidimutans]|uniref:Thiol:disulfide interchange protein DsbD N-terminal domain-containing protein n=2 Tax=Hankyongella ginsenosidimutans TaxID=1763828 RepID=A0A4D7CBI7_9SPHN|nr:hypothetical protein E6W36_09425 [Hankyongella ginsenosidimutans]